MIQAPKGTRDIFGAEAETFSRLETIARRVFDRYQFKEVRTPLFESADLFSRTLGATSDVVEKEMFTFADRGGRVFALRPEGTAGVVRHFLEQKLFVKGGVHRLYYAGAMFRAERPQAGRYRQFFQIGSEHFGDPSPAADTDTIVLVSKILRDFGVKEVTLQINSLGSDECRRKYRKVLSSYLEKRKKDLTEESRKRMTVNPLRVLDSKIDGPKLKDAPALAGYLLPGDAAHYKTVLSLLTEAGLPYEENPRLVRGLDYYTRTVFEFVSPQLGAQNAVAAGGRYDRLVKDLGGPDTPAVGFALGMDRLVSLLTQKQSDFSNRNISRLAVVAPLVEEGLRPAFRIAHQLREQGISAPPVMVRRKIKNILSLAVEMNANWAILIGEDELASRKATVKDLSTRDQTQVEFDEVARSLT